MHTQIICEHGCVCAWLRASLCIRVDVKNVRDHFPIFTFHLFRAFKYVCVRAHLDAHNRFDRLSRSLSLTLFLVPVREKIFCCCFLRWVDLSWFRCSCYQHHYRAMLMETIDRCKDCDDDDDDDAFHYFTIQIEWPGQICLSCTFLLVSFLLYFLSLSKPPYLTNWIQLCMSFAFNAFYN